MNPESFNKVFENINPEDNYLLEIIFDNGGILTYNQFVDAFPMYDNTFQPYKMARRINEVLEQLGLPYRIKSPSYKDRFPGVGYGLAHIDDIDPETNELFPESATHMQSRLEALLTKIIVEKVERGYISVDWQPGTIATSNRTEYNIGKVEVRSPMGNLLPIAVFRRINSIKEVQTLENIPIFFASGDHIDVVVAMFANEGYVDETVLERAGTPQKYLYAVVDYISASMQKLSPKLELVHSETHFAQYMFKTVKPTYPKERLQQLGREIINQIVFKGLKPVSRQVVFPTPFDVEGANVIVTVVNAKEVMDNHNIALRNPMFFRADRPFIVILDGYFKYSEEHGYAPSKVTFTLTERQMEIFLKFYGDNSDVEVTEVDRRSYEKLLVHLTKQGYQFEKQVGKHSFSPVAGHTRVVLPLGGRYNPESES